MGGFGAVNIDTAGLGSIISGIGSAAKDIRTAITGKAPIDPTMVAELDLKMKEIETGLTKAQITVDQAEAASPSTFVAGWRPGCGWLCVLGLAWQVFIWPLWTWVATLCKVPTPPNIETGVLVTLLIGMLGLGTMRTVEKSQDVQGNH